MNALPTFRAGDSATWTESLPAYPSAAGWSLKYRLIWPSGTAVEIATTASGASDYTANLTVANTTGWIAGLATLISRVEKGSGASLERATLGQAQVTILPDLNAAATFDGRSQAVKGLADARAALAAYMANGQMHVAEYDIAGRTMKFRTSKEITDLIAHYEIAVAGERAAAAIQQGVSPGRVVTRF